MLKGDAPIFSVVIPAFNRAHCIQAAIDSVLQQTCAEFELVIIDDGSTDATADLVAQIEDPRVKLHRQPNRGVSAARNAGIQQARGTWISFLDSDDLALPGWLEAIRHRVADDSSLGLVYCGQQIEYIGEQPPRSEMIFPRDRGGGDGIAPAIFTAGAFHVRRDVLLAAGPYVEQLKFSENTELLLRLRSHCSQHDVGIACVNEILSVCRRQAFAARARQAAYYQNILHATEYMLREHAGFFEGHPVAKLKYLTIAGVNAARLGRSRLARSYFLASLKQRPLSMAHWLRYTLACFPPLARVVWRGDRG